VLIHSAVKTTLGKVRTKNEDTFGFFPDWAFYVIADGMGGHVGGKIASALAVETMLNSLQRTQTEDLTPVRDEAGRLCLGGSRLLLAVQEANKAVLERSRQDPGLEGMGTTVAAVFLDPRDEVISICNVGDSRVYRVHQGSIEQLTEDHSFVQELFRKGKIALEEMKTSPHRHILTQAVGIGPVIQPRLCLTRSQPDDFFLLCSDGLYGAVEEQEMLHVLTQEGPDLEQQCETLVGLANERGGKDNCTVILLQCKADSEGETREMRHP
jgi:PPM family protein phosphatase